MSNEVVISIAKMNSLVDNNFDLDKNIPNKSSNASLFGSGLNLLKISLGAGIISLPLIVASFGYVLGPLILLIAAAMSLFGLYLYLECASYIGRTSSPFSLAEATFPVAGLILDICIVIKGLGVSLSYVIIIGTSCGKFFNGVFNLSDDNLISDPRLWMLLIGFFVLFPLSMLKTSKRLQFTSGVGILAVVYFVILSVYGVWTIPRPSSSRLFDGIPWARPITLSNIGLFGNSIFAFCCHQIIFTLYNETKNNKIYPMAIMCSASIGSGFVLYLIFALSSVITFSDRIGHEPGTVLSWYPTDSIPFQLARLLYATLISFSYPLQVLPFRVSAKRLLFLSDEKNNEFFTRFGLTLFFVLVTVGIGLLQPSFDIVLSLVGSMTSSVICYVLPTIFYLKITSKHSGGNRYVRIASLFLGVLGVFVFIICSTSSILRLFSTTN